MREIKFRAWHTLNKDMVNFDINKVCEDNYQQQHLCSLIRGDHGDVLMQFTGLQDKNGVDIWEGDIVESDYYLPDSREVQVVEIRSHDNFSGVYWGDDAFHYGNLTVIGNIHQNPELLK